MDKSRKVAVLLFDQVNAMDVAGPVEVFATARDSEGAPAYTVETWSFEEGAVRSESGLALCPDRCVPDAPQASLLLIPGGRGIRTPGEMDRIGGWIAQNADGFARIASVCTGAYALARSGLLDGCTIATHWASATDLQHRFPAIRVDPDALFVREGKLLSSGGIAAAIDLALEIVATDLGKPAAMAVARHMVVYLKRIGSQTQFSAPLEMQAQLSGTLEDTCIWAINNLQRDLSVEALAGRAGLSPRQFSRKFTTALGAPPAAFFKRLRCDSARVMLAEGHSVSRTAHSVGFRSVEGFRRAFHKLFGLSPHEYQVRFRTVGDVP